MHKIIIKFLKIRERIKWELQSLDKFNIFEVYQVFYHLLTHHIATSTHSVLSHLMISQLSSRDGPS